MRSHKTIESDVLAVIKRIPNCPVSTDRMKSACQQISATLGIPIHYGVTSNYDYCERLEIFFAARGRVIENDYHQAASMVTFYISEWGPFFTSRYRRKKGRNEWYADQSAGKRVSAVIAQMESELEKLGLRRIPEDLLQQPAPGQVTELDGIQATVFESLFSELP